LGRACSAQFFFFFTLNLPIITIAGGRHRQKTLNKMILFVPSCNTDQGVYHREEYLSDENSKCAMKVMMKEGFV